MLIFPIYLKKMADEVNAKLVHTAQIVSFRVRRAAIQKQISEMRTMYTDVVKL